MQESHFRMILGAALITALYFDVSLMMLGLLVLLAFEAVTNYRIPLLISSLRAPNTGQPSSVEADQNTSFRFNFEAERMLRVVLIIIITPAYFIYSEYIWFIPWFVAFALIGAGLSGFCPMVTLLGLAGFK